MLTVLQAGHCGLGPGEVQQHQGQAQDVPHQAGWLQRDGLFIYTFFWSYWGTSY